MPIHRIITTDSIGVSKDRVCDICKERKPGPYVIDQNNNTVCRDCQTPSQRALFGTSEEPDAAPTT